MNIPYHLAAFITFLCSILLAISVLTCHIGHALLCLAVTMVAWLIALNMNEPEEPEELQELEGKPENAPETENPRHRRFDELEQSGVI